MGDARRESYWDEVAESAGVTRRLREFAANNWGEHWRKADADAIERRLLNALVEDRRDDLADRRDDQAGEPPLSVRSCEMVPTICDSEGSDGGGFSDLPGDVAGSENSNGHDDLPPTVPPHDDPSDIDDVSGSGRSDLKGGSPHLKGPSLEEPERGVSDAAEAIQLAISRDRERQRKVLALIQQGEVAHAKRLATCGRKSVELSCTGCGESEYVPASCDSPLCEQCSKKDMGRVAGRYRDVVYSWDHPTMLRVSLPKRVDPDPESLKRGVDALRGAFGRLRRRKIPPSGDSYEREDILDPLRKVGERDLAARLRTQYINEGKWIPVEELLRGGFYGIDIKQQEDRRLYLHLHIIADCPWLPQAVLSELWDDIIDAPHVDIRRVYGRGRGDAESAVMEVAGYAAKPPDYERVEDEVAYMVALKGSPLIQPFGELYGNTPESGELRCETCEAVPVLGWEFVGIVDDPVGSAADGDRPPPESAAPSV